MVNNENNSNADIPESSSSKPMDSKQDVEQSPDEKINEDFPGYPHYPSREDIMDQQTGSHRVDADLESMGTGPNTSGVSQRYVSGKENIDSKNAGLDGSDEETGVPQNVDNDDLKNDNTVPGTDIDEAAEKGSTNP